MKVLAAAVLCVGLAVSATGLLASRPAAGAPRAGDKKPAAAADQERLQGTWEVVELVKGGVKHLPTADLEARVVFEGDMFRFILTPRGEGDFTRTAATLKLDPSKSPGEIDATLTEGASKGQVLPGIYELDGDVLKLCLAARTEDPRPTEFKAEEGEVVLFKLKRSKR